MYLIETTGSKTVEAILRSAAIVRPPSPGTLKRAETLGVPIQQLIDVRPKRGYRQHLKHQLFRLQSEETVIIPAQLNTPEWTELYRLFYPNGYTLSGCVREFRQYNFHYQFSHAARGRCLDAAKDFQILLLKRQIVTEQDLSSGRACIQIIEGVRYGLKPDEYHAWNQIGNIHIDWAYRQFNPQCGFPFVFHTRNCPWHDRGTT